MKIVDIFYVTRRQNLTKEQPIGELVERYSVLLGESERVKMTKEDTLKKKDIKRYMFGQVKSSANWSTHLHVSARHF